MGAGILIKTMSALESLFTLATTLQQLQAEGTLTAAQVEAAWSSMGVSLKAAEAAFNAAPGPAGSAQ